MSATSCCTLNGIDSHLAFACSAVVSRSSACLSVVVRCCLPVLPSSIVASLSLVGDVGDGAGNAGLF